MKNLNEANQIINQLEETIVVLSSQIHLMELSEAMRKKSFEERRMVGDIYKRTGTTIPDAFLHGTGYIIGRY